MDNFEIISVEDAKQMIESGEATVIDVRAEDAFEDEHIDGAIHVTQETMDEFMNSADKAKPVICYCYKGFSSQGAADYLASSGFSKVYSMEGGYEGWQASPDRNHYG